MSAIGPKRTWPSALHMSAFGAKPDMTFCAGCLLLPKTDIASLTQSGHDPSIFSVYADYGTHRQEVAIAPQRRRIKTGRGAAV